jgi:hypothetical protein
LRRSLGAAAGLAALGAAGAGVTVLALDHNEKGSEVASASKNTSVLRGLCDTVALAVAGNATAAEKLFDERWHGPVHDLAQTVSDDQGAAADRLRRADASVETAFDSDADQVTRHLRKLPDAVRQTFGAPGPSCPP